MFYDFVLRNIYFFLLSQGYPQVVGRLDTRYSPVRRSTPIKSKLSMSFPLDLHVLSL